GGGRAGGGELLAGLAAEGDDRVAAGGLQVGQRGGDERVVQGRDTAPRGLARAAADDEREREVLDPGRLGRLPEAELRVERHVDVRGELGRRRARAGAAATRRRGGARRDRVARPGEVAGGVGGPDGERVAGRGAETGDRGAGAGHAGHLGRAAVDAIAGDPDVVARGAPAQRDRAGRGRGR